MNNCNYWFYLFNFHHHHRPISWSLIFSDLMCYGSPLRVDGHSCIHAGNHSEFCVVYVVHVVFHWVSILSFRPGSSQLLCHCFVIILSLSWILSSTEFIQIYQVLLLSFKLILSQRLSYYDSQLSWGLCLTLSSSGSIQLRIVSYIKFIWDHPGLGWGILGPLAVFSRVM